MVKSFYSSDTLSPLTRFRDLVIFEERIRQNTISLSKVKRKHKLLSSSLTFWIIIYLFYWGFYGFFNPTDTIFNLALFILFCLSIVAFLWVIFYPVYSNKLTHSNKFDKQISKQLEAYNMSFNPDSKSDEGGAVGFSKRIPKKWQDIFFLYKDEYKRRKAAAGSLQTHQKNK